MGSSSSKALPLLIAAAGVGFAIYMFLSMRSVPTPSGQPPAGQGETGGAGDPGKVDDALIAHIQAGRYGEAYQLMTSAYRDSVPLEDFERAARGNRYLQTSKMIGCFRVVTYEKSVHLRECILRSEAGNAYATLHYALENGKWRMTGIMIGGTPAFPGFPASPPEDPPTP